ncbi:MAG: hypothetical protein Q8N96_03265, partial [Methylovulum sp.]|nr:hypothetical protein [Methylovulum sp.]
MRFCPPISVNGGQNRLPTLHGYVGRNKPVRAAARTGVSGKHHPPETPPRATRLDGLIPAYVLLIHHSL